MRANEPYCLNSCISSVNLHPTRHLRNPEPKEISNLVVTPKTEPPADISRAGEARAMAYKSRCPWKVHQCPSKYNTLKHILKAEFDGHHLPFKIQPAQARSLTKSLKRQA